MLSDHTSPATLSLDADLLPPGPVDLSGTVLAGRYRLASLLARGGMGAVYVAEHLVLRGEFAVKVLHPHYALERDSVTRFMQEARAMAQIRHPNVVPIMDIGRDGDTVFMVMELLTGRDLSQVLREAGGVLPWARLASIVLQICSALSAAHRASIFHRDIKPGNCVCTTLADGYDLIKVVDFGIAKALQSARLADPGDESPSTTPGTLLGTPEYMAPEIFRGARPDARVDIYAVGVLMYKMLTGSVPFPGASVERQTAPRQEPPAPGHHPQSRDVPLEVDAIVRRALAADPDRRFGDIDELMAAVRASPRVASPPDIEPTTRVSKSGPAVPRVTPSVEQTFESDIIDPLSAPRHRRATWTSLPLLTLAIAVVPLLSLLRGGFSGDEPTITPESTILVPEPSPEPSLPRSTKSSSHPDPQVNPDQPPPEAAPPEPLLDKPRDPPESFAPPPVLPNYLPPRMVQSTIDRHHKKIRACLTHVDLPQKLESGFDLTISGAGAASLPEADDFDAKEFHKALCVMQVLESIAFRKAQQGSTFEVTNGATAGTIRVVAKGDG